MIKIIIIYNNFSLKLALKDKTFNKSDELNFYSMYLRTSKTD